MKIGYPYKILNASTNKIRLLNKKIFVQMKIMLKIKNCEKLVYTNGYMYQHIKNAIDNSDGTMSITTETYGKKL
jgi:hypothetical protein